MSQYSRTNFLDLENATAFSDTIDGRFARKALDSRELGVSLFRYAAGHHSAAGHRHREQEEAYVVVAGSGRMRVDDDVFELKQWDVVRVAPTAVRGFSAGPDGLDVVAVGGTKPEGGDGEMVSDWWTE